VLSGKYTRANAGQHNADRGALVESFLNEETYAVIDELEIIAKAHETNVASVALAWVHAQPAVSSVIIGARRLSQLDDNVRAVDVNLSTDELARLDALTKPAFGFPNNMLEMAPGIINGGTTINGVSAAPSEYVMPEGVRPY
jgi:aryl-alcohol dehydrogenase-like predicted oxidoreductase